MRKLTLVFAFLIIAIKGYSQESLELPLIDGEVTYSETIETDLSKDQLYGNLKAWIASNFSKGKMTMDLDDVSNGRVIIKFKENPSFESLGMVRSSELQYFLQIDVKANKFRYILKLIDHYHKQTAQTVPELIEIANGRKKTITNTRAYAKKQVKLIGDSASQIIESLKKGIQFVDDF